MSNPDLSSVLFLLLLLVGLAQLLGYAFTKLRQPKVVGEILAGVLIGPSVLGRLHAASGLMASFKHQDPSLSLVYWLGLLLLMFLSGAEARQLFGPDERRAVLCLSILGTGIPFALGLLGGFTLGAHLLTPALFGPNGNNLSLTIILAVAVAVTSVPVVSKIFLDLNIIHTRFARLVLGVAVLEDIVLWLALAVATAVAGHTAVTAQTAIAGHTAVAGQTAVTAQTVVAGHTALNPRALALHLATTVAFFALGLTLFPRAIKRASKSRFNVFAKHSPVGYILTILLAYCALAGALDVSMVFAAFLAGFAVVHKRRRLFADALEAIAKVAFAFFVPAYFAIVGLKLNLTHGFSLAMLAAFLLGSCAIKLVSVASAGRIAGFRGLDLINLAITMNARGGPGIVLASVAFDAGIISPKFYTTLVIAAVLTSQIAGVWLDYTQRNHLPLLQGDPDSDPKVTPFHHPPAVA